MEYDEETLRHMCSDCGILTFYEKSCSLVDAWMEGKEMPSDLSTFEEYVLNGGVFGNSENALASKQGEHRGFSFYFHRVFLSRSLLETKYPEIKKKPYLLPICQIKRWLRLFNLQKREQVKKEINGVRSMRPETINAFDQLLTDLGL